MTASPATNWTRYLPALLLLAAGVGFALACWGYVRAASLAVASPSREVFWQLSAMTYGYVAIGAILLAILGVALQFHVPTARAPSARTAFAAGLVGFGLTKMVVHAFLLLWIVASAGQSDIAARGPFLLDLFMHPLAVISFVLTLGGMAFLTRGSQQPLLTRLWPSALGAGIGGLIIFGMDPTVPLLRSIPWPSSTLYSFASALVAGLALVAGIRLGRLPAGGRSERGEALVTA